MKTRALFFLFCYTVVFAQNPGDTLFAGWNAVHSIDFTFSSPYWYDTLQAYYQINNSANADSNLYLMADVTVDGVLYPSCGVRMKGNSSYNNGSTKKSFVISFDEFVDGQKCDGMGALNLNNGFKDPSQMREKLMLDFLRDHDIPAPRAHYTQLSVNGQPYAFYNLIEDVDKKFLKSWFGNKGGNLFKGDPHGSLQWLGANPSAYWNEYELKTNEDSNDFQDLTHLINIVNNTPIANFEDSLRSTLNVERYLKSYAATMLFANMDSYCGSGHNYYLYHEKDSNRFEWIMWDVNEAYGTFSGGGMPNPQTTMSMYYVPNNRPLNTNILQNTNLKNLYKTYMCQFLDDFQLSAMEAKMDSLHAQIAPYIYADTRKFYTNTQFDNSLTQNINSGVTIWGLKPFTTARYNFLVNELAGFTCTPTAISLADYSPAYLYPNPAQDYLILHAPALSEWEIWDMQGNLLQKGQTQTSEISLPIEGFTKGIYCVRIQQGGKTEVLKWVKGG